MNYYQILNVSKNATSQQIREAYRRLAFEYHPDRNAENPSASEKMKEINEAYAVLSDPDKRSQYDNMFHQYGQNANDHFRKSYSEQEIFKGSDIHQIFEEMARSFGLRGFDEIFKGDYGQDFRRFEFRQPGFLGKGIFFGDGMNFGKKNSRTGNFFGGILKNLLNKMTGIAIPQNGGDLQDSITINPELARTGGAFAYLHPNKKKKLVVQIPPGIREGQRIRLAGLGKQGQNGGTSGDLFLKVHLKKSIMNKIKEMINFTDLSFKK